VSRRAIALVALVALLTSAVACGPSSPDYQSIIASSTSTTTTTTRVEKPVPLSEYLQNNGVTGRQVATNTLPDLTVSIPTPPGWTPYRNEHITPETVIISKGGKYPTARLVVFKLQGDFDPAQVIKHGNDDAQLFENFKQLDASSADFNGFPSSMIQGSYDLDGTRLHSWNRIVLPTSRPPANQRYLVQLTITSLANQAVVQSDDIETIIRGFVVTAK
jgi:Probable lipoprotein LpqN